jgi:hypothetical protein
MNLLRLPLVSAVFASGSLFAQVLPQERSYDLMVSDSDANKVIRLADRTQNGLFQGVASEHSVFYDGLIAGGPSLDTPSSLAFDSRGHLFVADTGADLILRLIDRTGDGMATSAANGEWQVFCDQSNGSGVTLPSIVKIAFDGNGVLYGLNSGVSAQPLDHVFRAVDLNADGDANDPGEITIFYDGTQGPFVLGTPFGLALDPISSDVYVSDVNPDGIYRLRDSNGDGDAVDAGEAALVYDGLGGGPLLSNANTLRFHPDGDLYYNDATTDQIVRLHDLTSDGDFNDPGEATVFADLTGNPLAVPKNHFDIEIDENGVIWAVENSTYDAIIRYEDLNNDDDAQDPGEVVKVYDSAIGPGVIGLPRALARVPAPRLLGPSFVQVGQFLQIDVRSTDGEAYQMLLGVQSLGFSASVPPYGTIGFVPLLAFFSGTLDGNGEASLVLPVPAGSPAPVTVYFGAACGNGSFRTYLSNDLAVSILP